MTEVAIEAKAEREVEPSFLRLAEKFGFDFDAESDTPESQLWTLLHNMLGARYLRFPAVRPEGVQAIENGLLFYQKPTFFYTPGWEVTILEDVGSDDDQVTFRYRTLNAETLAKGWDICCVDYPGISSRIRGMEYDRDDADVLLQLALLGKVVYG